tara:strand:- start:340 stop:582 length:243 start_codon:yes stop_codon:yes gene_type:complete
MVDSARQYVIVNVADITDEMIDNAIQKSTNTLRRSLDNSKALLKWVGDTPACFDGMTTYTYSEICEELKKSNWFEDRGDI